MNTKGNLECTCDIGPFATCPVCKAREINFPRPCHRPRRRFMEQNEDAALAQRIVEIKAGYMK